MSLWRQDCWNVAISINKNNKPVPTEGGPGEQAEWYTFFIKKGVRKTRAAGILSLLYDHQEWNVKRLMGQATEFCEEVL